MTAPQTKQQAAITLQGVSKSFGKVAVLKSLDLVVEHGAIHGLVGLNGSGKTTTLDCILGLRPIDSGAISVLDLPPSHLYRAEGRVVAIFDTPSLHTHLSVRQALEHARLLLPNPERDVDEVMSLLEINRYANYKVRSLSLGNRRRASIAHALLGNPELILLDEPFNGLDAGGVDEVLELISRFNREFGMSFLLSSHQLPYLQTICTHLSVLHEGRIAVSGSVESLLAATSARVEITTPQCEAAQELLATMSGLSIERIINNVLHIVLQGAKPAEINRKLIESGIEVEELVHGQASLNTVFREHTSDTPTSIASRGAL